MAIMREFSPPGYMRTKQNIDKQWREGYCMYWYCLRILNWAN